MAERADKAIRSPAKSALLADAAGQVGMGSGWGVHKALDQIGAFAGPLLVALLVDVAATSTGGLQLALVVLAIPGAVAMILLVLTRRRVPPTASTPTGPFVVHPLGGRARPAGRWEVDCRACSGA